MINEFSVSPRPSNNRARHLFFIFLVLATTTAAIYISPIPRFRGIVGLVCLLFIVAAIYVYNRFIAMKYFYDVMIDSSGTPLFVVRGVIGKRETTFCRVELADVISVKRLSADEIKKHKTPVGYVRYFYNSTLSPDSVCLVTISSRYEHSEITIEGNDEFVNLLSAYATEARATFPRDDE